MTSGVAGWGRLFLDPAKYHDDFRLWRRAIRQRWNIDDDFKEVSLRRLQKIIADGPSDSLAIDAIAEARLLMAQNQKDEHKVLDVRVQIRHDQLPGIAADLGIDVGLIEDAAREADSGAGDSEGEGG